MKKILSLLRYIFIIININIINTQATCNNRRSNFNSSIFCLPCISTPVRTIVHFRSPSANTARQLVGWQWELNKPFMCENYGAFYLAYEHQKSFKSTDIANQVFGSSILKFSGSSVPNRCNNELLAENFGLPSNFIGQVKFCPTIRNDILELGVYWGVDYWIQGAYIRLHASIVRTAWNLNGKECIVNSNPFLAPCSVDSTTDLPTPAATDLQEALSGTFLFGDMKTKWPSGRFFFGHREKIGFSNTDLIFGYNWFNNDCSHLGTYIQLILPTSARPKNRYIFEPILDNRHHVELGGGASAHTSLWACNEHNLALFLEGYISHMFAHKECRLYDFSSLGAYSRYVLLKEYDKFTGLYTGRLVSATETNTKESKVKVNVKGDMSVKLAYRWCNFIADLGYNLYGQSMETVILNNCEFCNPAVQYAVKGLEPVCCFNHQLATQPNGTFVEPEGFIRTVVESNPGNCPNFPEIGEPFTVTQQINQSAQPTATAFSSPQPTGTATTCTVCLDQKITEPIEVFELSEHGINIISSRTPTKFISLGDLNIRSAQAESVLTHKIFAHIGYCWYDLCGYNPHIGVGGEIEMNGKRRNDVTGTKFGLNQWGVWIKGGLSF